MPYLRSYQGDPGIGSFFRKLIPLAVGFAAGGPLGLAVAAAQATGQRGAVQTAFPGTRALPPAPQMAQAMPGSASFLQATGRPVVPSPGIRGRIERTLPGGRTGFQVAGPGAGVNGPRRRRMNVANAKALRRAIRRQAGFVKLARKALKGTGYTIVTRGSRSRRPLSVKESGPGSVILRS